MPTQDTRDCPQLHGLTPARCDRRPAKRHQGAPTRRATHQKQSPTSVRPSPVGNRPQGLPRNRSRGRFSMPVVGFAKVELSTRLRGTTATFRTKTAQSE